MNLHIRRTHSGAESQPPEKRLACRSRLRDHENGFCLKASTFALSLGEVKLKALDVRPGKQKVKHEFPTQ